MTTHVDNVVVLGAGAIGMLLGAYLEIGGQATVSLIGRDPHMTAIRENGLKVKFPSGSEASVRIAAFTRMDEVPSKPDWIILGVRTYQTREAMQQIVNHWGTGVPVVTFQNGFTLNHIQSFIGENAIGGETLISSKIISPGVLEQPQHTGLYLGEMSKKLTPRIERMRRAFEAVRQYFDCMEAFVTDNIIGAIWAKLAVNATNNTLTAVTNFGLRTLYQTAETQQYSFGLVTETLKVANLEGVDIYSTPVALAKAFMDNSSTIEQWRSYLSQRAPTLSDFRLSMADMLDKGIKTEIDDINGYVVERAHAHGLAVPHHEAIVQTVHQIERGVVSRGIESLPKIG